MKLLSIAKFTGLSMLMGLLACNTEQEPAQVSTRVNFFSMQVNDVAWKPFEKAGDPCYSTFQFVNGSIGNIPTYSVRASNGTKGINGQEGASTVIIELVGIERPGTYTLEGTYTQPGTSYLNLYVHQPVDGGSYKNLKYTNIAGKQEVTVKIDEIFPIHGSSTMNGIKGSFQGYLYNEANPMDSIRISEGNFIFKTGFTNYDQCD
jgi:hypothetical protein